jgi:gamma-glutamyltranspeptidase/glutathione hydrolase
MRWLLALLILAATPAVAETPPHQMIAASHPLAADAGLAVLHEGGTAADAAIAAELVLAVVAPQEAGLGGDGFALVFTPGAPAVESWDGRAAAPAATGPDLFLRRDGTPMPADQASQGGRAVGVPGLLRLLEALHKAHGRLPWNRLLQPAIGFAENGFPLSPRVAAAIAADPRIGQTPALRAALLAPDGAAWPPGHVIGAPRLAETLRAIAQGGAGAFYQGPIAADIATAVRSDANAGLLTTDDLAAYRARPRPALCRRYRDLTVCSMGPPSSGGVEILETLGLLQHFRLAALDPQGPELAHLLGEAGRLAAADRDMYLADDSFQPVPLPGLLAPDYLTVRAQAIDPDQTMPPPRAGNPSWRGPPLAPAPRHVEHGTSQVTVVDGSGMAVSLTSTLQDRFGAHLMVDGVLLNDALTQFSFVPRVKGRLVANRVAGGKRPRSAMAPTMVLNPAGELRLVTGAQGGGQIPGLIVESLVRRLDFQQTPAEARPLTIAVTPEGLVGTADAARDGAALGE